MNIKILCVIAAIALILCACGSAPSSDPKQPGNQSGTNQTPGDSTGTGDNTPENPSANPSEDAGEETFDSYFNPDDDNPGEEIIITLPESIQGITLPHDEFDEDDEGVLSSKPVGEEVPEVTEPTITEAPTEPAEPSKPPMTLPEDVFEE